MYDEIDSGTGNNNISSHKNRLLLEVGGGLLVAVVLFIIITIVFPSTHIQGEPCGNGSVILRSVWYSTNGDSLFVVIDNRGTGNILRDEAMPTEIFIHGRLDGGTFSRTLNTSLCMPFIGGDDVLEPWAEPVPVETSDMAQEREDPPHSILFLECAGLDLNTSLENLLDAQITLSCGAMLEMEVDRVSSET